MDQIYYSSPTFARPEKDLHVINQQYIHYMRLFSCWSADSFTSQQKQVQTPLRGKCLVKLVRKQSQNKRNHLKERGGKDAGRQAGRQAAGRVSLLLSASTSNNYEWT